MYGNIIRSVNGPNTSSLRCFAKLFFGSLVLGPVKKYAKKLKKKKSSKGKTTHESNRPVSYSQLPLIIMTIDSFLQYETRLDVKYSYIPKKI